MSKIIFSEKDYLEANADVHEAVKKGIFKNGYEHYIKYGEKEGRHLRKVFSRFDKVFSRLDKKGRGLEIGPSHNPIAPKRDGFNVHILDHASKEQLREKYKDAGVNLSNIEDVDYVWTGKEYKETIGHEKYFDWIIASHVIEHVPNMVRFLNECEAVLKDSGKLSLVIPDARFCFDYFTPLSSTGNFLDAFAENRIKPSCGQVFDHFANAAMLDNKITWSSSFIDCPDKLIHSFDQAKSQYTQCVNDDHYIDLHCSRFVPETFNLIISDLRDLGLINLKIIHEFPTDGCEFYVTLAKLDDSDKNLISSKSSRIDTLKFIHNIFSVHHS